MMFLMKFWGVLVTWPHLRKVGSCCRRYPFMSCNKNWFYLAAKLLFRSSGFSLLNVHTIFTHVKVCRFWKPLHCHFLSVYWHKTLVLLKVPTIVFEVPNLFSSFSLNTFWICWFDTKKVFIPVHEFWQNSNMSSGVWIWSNNGRHRLHGCLLFYCATHMASDGPFPWAVEKMQRGSWMPKIFLMVSLIIKVL